VQNRWAEGKDFEMSEGGDPYREGAEHTIDLKASIEDVRDQLAGTLKLGRVLVHAVQFKNGELVEIKQGAPVPHEAEKAVTVAKPVRGCPAPNFDLINHRASEVLRAFLNEQQCDDFDRLQRFVSVGADTGHRYMLTSRECPAALKRFGGRQLFDLDQRQSFCVHYDLDVPAPEEILALHVFLSLPGHEMYLREVTDGHGPPTFTPNRPAS
jgi:hypothetical protein